MTPADQKDDETIHLNSVDMSGSIFDLHVGGAFSGKKHKGLRILRDKPLYILWAKHSVKPNPCLSRFTS